MLNFKYDGVDQTRSQELYRNDYDILFKKFVSTIEDPNYGFFYLAKNRQLLQSCQDAARNFKNRRHFVHIGIGGSSLGAEMLLDALANSPDKTFTFINNIDPEKISQQLQTVIPEDTVFYFVSKSGGTAETLAVLAIITQFLKDKIGANDEDLKKYFVFCSDPKKGDLRSLGLELGITTLDVPSNVGGRFSALTPTGLFPAVFAGINCEELLAGAHEMSELILSAPAQQNPLLQFCISILDYKQHGITQTVMMPYSSHLKSFSSWFVQLWAESLGKMHNQDGEIVHQGLTPIVAYGATDQHSQMQLFMHGPHDKIIIFLKINKFAKDFSLKNSFEKSSLQKLTPFSLANLMEAELEGTLMALKEASRPYLLIELDQLGAANLGALVLFFECLTTIVGRGLNIDPFDQPGVEDGKKYAFDYLSKMLS